MGYGSPEMLHLYKMLDMNGFDVMLSDQEDDTRKYYNMPNYKRFFRKNLKNLEKNIASAHYQEIKDFSLSFQPDIIISSFAPFLLDEKFPLNKKDAIKVLYAAELFHWQNEQNFNKIQYLIAPNEQRLEILSKQYPEAKKYLIYNANLKNEGVSYKVEFGSDIIKAKNNLLHILYQGQISNISGVGILLDALQNTSSCFLHLCGDIRDSELKEIIDGLERDGKLKFYGFLAKDKIKTIRDKCDVGYIGWREDLTEDLAIRYCCPTKLYDYISAELPVVFIKNDTLDRWNNMFGFGISSGTYNDPKRLANIFDGIFRNKDCLMAIKHRLRSLYLSQLNYEWQSHDFVEDLIKLDRV